MHVSKYCTVIILMILALPVFSQTWQDDSLVVRQILDTNDLDTVLVDNIAKKYNGRINSLYFYNMPSFHILPSTIRALTTLVALRICNTGIVSIPHDIGNLKFLRIMELIRSKITSLPPEIGNLDSLMTLDISVNELTAIPPEIGNCKKIYSFSFTSNKIKRIPDEICDMVSLKSISAQGNLIDYVPEDIGNMPVIHGVDLEWNKLKHVPNSLIPLSLDDVKLCFNDSLVFTEDQKAAWGFEDYQEYYDVACVVEADEDYASSKQESNAQIKITHSTISLQVNCGGHITCSVYNPFSPFCD